MSKIPKDFIAFDLETTGFAPPCKIIEIGAVKVINGKVAEQFQTFVNPCCSIPRHITELTGINNKMVFNAPTIEEALPLFIDFVDGLPIAAHNATFDMKFLHFETMKLGCCLSSLVIDTLTLSRRHYPRLENHKLNTVAQYIGVINQSEHRGLYDAIVVAEILLRIAEKEVI